MADTRVVLHLLLLSLIRTGVSEEDDLTDAEPAYKIKHVCGQDVVCFQIWQISSEEKHSYIAIISNGEIQTASALDYEDSQCTLKINDPIAGDVGHHYCKRRLTELSPYNSPTADLQLNLLPDKSVSLQCVLLTYIQKGHCYTQIQQRVNLMWIDEAGEEIQEDSQHIIKQESTCDITLTITSQSAVQRKFRCRATVDNEVLTSEEFRVRVPAPRRKGRRGGMPELEPESQDGSQDMVSLTVGLVGCAVLSVVVAVFVINKRRTSQRLPKEPCHTISTDKVVDTEDVIYAEIMLPLGSDRVLIHESESTEYACVRYN